MSIRQQPRASEGIGTLKLLAAQDLPTVVQQNAGEPDSVDELIHHASRCS